jgi:hypothetical protein
LQPEDRSSRAERDNKRHPSLASLPEGTNETTCLIN